MRASPPKTRREFVPPRAFGTPSSFDIVSLIHPTHLQKISNRLLVEQPHDPCSLALFVKMSNFQSYNDGGYQQSNYNAGGGYNSGGFVASQTTPGGEKKVGNNALRPVQIKQILEATQSHPDADFKIDDSEISALTFCGRVMNVSSAATNTTYKIDDGTGSIEVKRWVDSDRAAAAAGNDGESEIRNDAHVRVHGTLKSFNQKRHVGVTSIKLVTDERELRYHETECRFVSLYFTRGPLLGVGGAAGHGDGTYRVDGAGGAAGGGGGGGHDNSELASKMGQLDPFSRRVMEVIHASPDSNEGINVRTLQGMIGGGGNLLATIESLKEDGHLYTTIDEDHVKSTML